MSAWQRLLERKIVQWTVAYAAAAWVVLQVVDVLGEQWAWSIGLQRAVGVLLAAGLFITVVVAWHHGERGRQGVSTGEVVTIIGLLLLGGIGAFRAVSDPVGEQVSEEAEAGVDARPALAALPWVNLSERAEDAYFADGVRDEIMTRLARLSGLRLVSRSSALAYRDTDKPMPAIARELGVRYVLEGGLLRSGESVRVDVKLFDGPGDEQLWTSTYDRELTAENLLEILTDISTRVAAELSATLSPAERSRIEAPSTMQLDALDLYFLGRQRWEQRDRESLDEAIELFREATGIDAGFARAWAGLADALAVRHFHYIRPSDGVSYEQAIEAASRAIELDPGLAEAHASLAFALMYGRWDWEGAEQSFQEALRLDPDYSVTHYWHCELLVIRKKLDEALDACARAIEVDPRSATAHNVSAVPYYALGRFEEAIRGSARAAELAPDWPAPRNDLALNYGLRGDSAAAWRAAGDVASARLVAELLTASPERVVDIVRRYEDDGGLDPVFAAMAFGSAGIIDSLVARVEEAIGARNDYLPLLFAAILRGQIGSDPRLSELERRMGLEP